MNKRLSIFLALAICLVVGFSIAVLRVNPTVQAKNQQSDALKGQGQAGAFDRINDKARSARRGGLAEMRELTNAVIDPYVGSNPIVNADGTMAEVKERVARAEFAYRQGHNDGVSEDRVIRVVNGLGKKFNAPEYAKTDLAEVRTHRMALLAVTPQLTTINHQPTGKGQAGISSNMSPIEAVNVTMSLVYQKVFNEEYQKDASEREVQRRANRSRAGTQAALAATHSNAPSERTVEMLKVARRGSLPLLLPGRAKSFAFRTLDILGIPAIKENK
jgi:hypothetical protein